MVSIGSGEEGMLIGSFEVIVTSKLEEETTGYISCKSWCMQPDRPSVRFAAFPAVVVRNSQVCDIVLYIYSSFRVRVQVNE